MFTRKLFKQIVPNISFVLNLPVLMLLAVSFTPVRSQSPEKPGPWIPPINNIRIMGGIASSPSPAKSFLSIGSDGSYADLYNKDDASGRQRWVFQLSPDGQSYNIMVEGGTVPGRKYLSTTADGTKVDLFTKDDGSGRQRWTMEPVRRNAGETYEVPSYNFHIMVRGGVNNNRKYLSSNSDGSRIDLSDTDDGSKRQIWALSLPVGKQFYIQSSSGISTGHSVLGKLNNKWSTTLYSGDDNSGSQRWNIWMGKVQDYLISMPFKNDYGNRLILNTRGSLAGDAPWSDTGCGDCQKLTIEDIGSGLVRIRTLMRINRTQRVYLSVSPDGTQITQSNVDDGSGRQRWKISNVR